MCKKKLIGRDYKTIINTLNLRQYELAQELGCSPALLNFFLNEKRNLAEVYLQKLNEILGIK